MASQKAAPERSLASGCPPSHSPGSSLVMNPAGPSWPRLRALWALWPLTAVLLSPWRLWAVEDNQECTWQVVLNKFETVGQNHGSDRFFEQEPLDTVDSLFGLLVDAPLDPEEVRRLGSGEWERSWKCIRLGSEHLPNLSLQRYLGFPYYLKINYSCKGEVSVCSWSGLILCEPVSP